MCVCVLLMSSTNQSRGETTLFIKEISVKNEAYCISKGWYHQSSMEVTENVTNTVEQQPLLSRLWGNEST